ncbi:MAG: hypothetical protein HYU71_08695 [Bacteroidetes bacterium]|nr:hypothetical protein [Bacteroidota bacterium]
MLNQTNRTIRSLADLQAEMQATQLRIKERETGLATRLQSLPGEVVKSVAAGVVPLFLGGELATGAWKLAKGAFELIRSRKSGNQAANTGDWKADLLGGARKLGLFGALKLLFGLWKGK